MPKGCGSAVCAPDFQKMEKRFDCGRDALMQTRVTFWFYVGSIPIIIFLFLLPYIRQGSFTLGPYSLVYLAIIAFLLFGAYRAMRVMLSVKNSFCVIDGERVYGVSTPNPYQKAIPFDIRKDDIRGIGKTTVSIGGMRTKDALVLNTDNEKIVLLALDRSDELKTELES